MLDLSLDTHKVFKTWSKPRTNDKTKSTAKNMRFDSIKSFQLKQKNMVAIGSFMMNVLESPSCSREKSDFQFDLLQRESLNFRDFGSGVDTVKHT